MVAFLVQFSSQHKPVPTNQPLSTFGHLHLSKATNSRNNPIPANAVEAKKQVRPPSSRVSAITLGYVRTFIRTGIFIGRRSVPQPVYRLQVNPPRLCLQLREKVQESELISKSEVNQNIESPINYHTWSGRWLLLMAHALPSGWFLLKIDWRCNLIFFLHETESHSFEYSIDVKSMYTCLWVQFLLFTSS